MQLVKWKNFEVVISEHETFLLDGEHSAVRGLERFKGEVKTMVDIGAHIGLSALGAVDIGAHTVYAFEASPENFEVCWTNIRRNQVYGRVLPLNLAVWAESGALLPLRRAGTNSGQLSSSFRDMYGVEAICKSISFLDMLRLVNQPIDYLKIDTEGAEFWMLTPNDEVIDTIKKKVKYLDLEVHDPLNAQYFDSSWFESNNPFYKNTAHARAEMLDVLSACGFTELNDEGKYLSGYNTAYGP